MASKLPFKIFDWKQKLTTWGIRINKTIKHKLLSKSRNALIISTDSAGMDNPSARTFDSKLKDQLKKTWLFYQLNINENKLMNEGKDIQAEFKGRQYDAIIVMPQSNRKLPHYYDINQQQFATDTRIYDTNLMKNIMAYRLAHKYLATSGVLILSNSQADFAKVENKNGVPLVTQPALKNILDAQVSYLGVVVGDRDYTDLNSWSVVGLSEEFVGTEHEDYVIGMYGAWVNGSNLPMPGSFALFKMREEGKKQPFVQYL